MIEFKKARPTKEHIHRVRERERERANEKEAEEEKSMERSDKRDVQVAEGSDGLVSYWGFGAVLASYNHPMMLLSLGPYFSLLASLFAVQYQCRRGLRRERVLEPAAESEWASLSQERLGLGRLVLKYTRRVGGCWIPMPA